MLHHHHHLTFGLPILKNLGQFIRAFQETASRLQAIFDRMRCFNTQFLDHHHHSNLTHLSSFLDYNDRFSFSDYSSEEEKNPWSYELLSNNKISCFNVIHGYPFEFILGTRVRCSRAISIQLIKIDLLEKRDWLCILTWSFYGGQV